MHSLDQMISFPPQLSYLCQSRSSVSCRYLWMIHHRYGLTGGLQKLPEHGFHLLDLLDLWGGKKGVKFRLWFEHITCCFEEIVIIQNENSVSSLPGSVFCFLAEFFFLPPVAVGAAPSRTLVSATMGASFLTGAGACSALTSGCWSSPGKGQIREEYCQSEPVCLETDNRRYLLLFELHLRMWQPHIFLHCNL